MQKSKCKHTLQDTVVWCLCVKNERARKARTFYKENTILWNSNDPEHNNRQKHTDVKKSMYDLFDGKYEIEKLEKNLSFSAHVYG